MSKPPRHSPIQDIGDLVCLIAAIPLCMWLGWWGVLPALLLGFAVNLIGADHE